MPSRPRTLAVFAAAAAAAACSWGCKGEEKTYTAGLVRGARAGETLESSQRLEQIGAALERYALDHSRYPDAASVAEAEAALAPDYARTLPRTDGWGHALRLTSRADTFTISSDGQDGAPDTADDLRREAGQRVQAPPP